MNRFISFTFSIILLLALFAGCSRTGTEPTLEPTSNRATIDSTEDAANKNNIEQDGLEAERDSLLGLTDVERFSELLTYDGGYWYWRILGCTFDNPEDISLKYMFYNGIHPDSVQSQDTYSDSEIAFLKNQAKSDWGDEAVWVNAHKMPRQYINDILAKYLGLSLDEVTIPKEWTHFEETDAYYYIRTDGYAVSGHRVTEVNNLSDGSVQVYWTAPLLRNTVTGELMENPQMILTLRQQADGGYLVLSNQPVE